LKDDGQPHKGWGANPTGSFKDRGMSMAISMAKHFGIKKVVVPTQGNAGDSLAEYAIKAGMESVIIMPDDTPMPILGRVSALAKMRDDIEIELVKGTIREAAALMKEKYLPQGYFNMATFQEPGWRIDGKKTLGYELAEPEDGKTQTWKLPDVVLYPTGGGTGILGMWKAFDELERLGLIDSKRPKIISVQAANTAPVVNAYNQGDTDTTPAEPGETIATGLNVPGGVGHFKVLDIIKQSGGMAIAVDEAAISTNLYSVYREYGIWICPEGAATIAALEPAVEKGMIKEGDKVVAFNTGSFEKYLPNVRHLIF
jgi:threonine synthase